MTGGLGGKIVGNIKSKNFHFMAITEFWLQLWATPPTRDNDKSASTYALIKAILERKFGNKVKIFLQWSYANRTNIKKDSDIDIVICYQDSCFTDTSKLSEKDKELYNSNRTDATYKFSNFKNDVQKCLEESFWKNPHTERKDKCIRIYWNHTRVDADMVPCFVHKRFKTHNTTSAEWVEFVSDSWIHSISFPKQHIQNWENKNTRTKENYKDTVRILKNCKKELVERGLIEDELISSFFIECLVWNVPDTYFNKTSYLDITKSILEKIYSDIQNAETTNKYTEINSLFYLIRSKRTKITREDVIKFLEVAYWYIFNP